VKDDETDAMLVVAWAVLWVGGKVYAPAVELVGATVAAMAAMPVAP
jgi:hypothetical protein